MTHTEMHRRVGKEEQKKKERKNINVDGKIILSRYELEKTEKNKATTATIKDATAAEYYKKMSKRQDKHKFCVVVA